MEKEIKDMNAAEYAAFIERITIAAKAEDKEAEDNDAYFAKLDDEDNDEDDAEDDPDDEAAPGYGYNKP